MGSVPAFSVESKTLRDVMRFSSKHADDVARGVGGSGEVRQLVPHQLSDSEKNFTSVHQVIGRMQRKLSGIKLRMNKVLSKLLLLKR